MVAVGDMERSVGGERELGYRVNCVDMSVFGQLMGPHCTAHSIC